MDWLENFKGINVRFIKAPNGQPVIVGTCLIEALKGNRNNSATIIKNNVRDKWWIDLPNPDGGKSIRCLFEPGAYQLASNPMFTTEFAEEFQDWLFEEVIPKLRAEGYYIMPTATQQQLEAMEAEIKMLKDAHNTAVCYFFTNKPKKLLERMRELICGSGSFPRGFSKKLNEILLNRYEITTDGEMSQKDEIYIRRKYSGFEHDYFLAFGETVDYFYQNGDDDETFDLWMKYKKLKFIQVI